MKRFVSLENREVRHCNNSGKMSARFPSRAAEGQLARRSFPGSMAIVFLDEGSDIRKRIMLHLSRKIIGSTIEQYVLVHFVVARVKPTASLNSLIASFPVSEEPQVPARKITTVIDPTVQKPKPAVQVKSIQLRAANGRPDLAFQFRRYALIRIDDQHPVVPPGN